MSLNFPSSPVDGEISLQPNGVTYQFNLALNRWEASTVPQVPAILGKQTVLSANTTFIPDNRTVSIKFILTGGGGGGGGVSATGSGTSVNSIGGGAGATCIKYQDRPEVTYDIVVGAGGAGGASGSNSGANGGVSSVTSASLALVAGGGVGGAGKSGGNNTRSVGVSGGAATGGDINTQGGASSGVFVQESRNSMTSTPGQSYWGGGPYSLDGSNGTDALCIGAGGGATHSKDSGSNKGWGDGVNGIVIVEVFFSTPVGAVQVEPGMTVQVANFQTGSVATGTGTIPFDNTIPQITEGDEYMTLPFTPKFANSMLLIDVRILLQNTANNSRNIVAIFQDAIADALAASDMFEGTAAAEGSQTLLHKVTAGDVALRTFRVRAGGNQAGTTTFNGNGGSGLFGGVVASSITITEIAQ